MRGGGNEKDFSRYDTSQGKSKCKKSLQMLSLEGKRNGAGGQLRNKTQRSRQGGGVVGMTLNGNCTEKKNRKGRAKKLGREIKGGAVRGGSFILTCPEREILREERGRGHKKGETSRGGRPRGKGTRRK